MPDAAIRRLILGAMIVLSATGAVAQVNERREPVKETDLPKPVAEAMHSHPRAIFVSAIRATRGTSVEYRLTVKGTRKTALVVKPDGTVVSFK